MKLLRDVRVQHLYEDILFIWAVRHPASGYVQGMNDILTPFFVVFLQPFFPDTRPEDLEDIGGLPDAELCNIEADCFWCFGKLLEGIQDIVSRVDGALHTWIRGEDVLYNDFSIRWMNCLLFPAFRIPLILRIWDLYLSQVSRTAALQVCMCAAMLTSISRQIQCSRQTELLTFIKGIGPDFWTEDQLELILAQAYVYEQSFSLGSV
jgi:hypothetical protein